jgi:hypothetical protein
VADSFHDEFRTDALQLDGYQCGKLSGSLLSDCIGSANALERVKKYCGQPAENIWKRVFWRFGLVSAQSQAAAGVLLRQSLAKTPKIPAPNGYSIFLPALMLEGTSIRLLKPEHNKSNLYCCLRHGF